MSQPMYVRDVFAKSSKRKNGECSYRYRIILPRILARTELLLVHIFWTPLNSAFLARAMADVISMIAGIGSILKAFGSTGVYLRSVSNASKETQLIADQLHATEAVLKALETSLKVSPPSPKSYTVWADPMNLVLGKIKSIIDDLNTKLSSQRGVVILSFRKKIMWPFDKDDSEVLLAHLKAHLHVLLIAQTSLTRYAISFDRYSNTTDGLDQQCENYSEVGTRDWWHIDTGGKSISFNDSPIEREDDYTLGFGLPNKRTITRDKE
jgi:hypothetical protein